MVRAAAGILLLIGIVFGLALVYRLARWALDRLTSGGPYDVCPYCGAAELARPVPATMVNAMAFALTFLGLLGTVVGVVQLVTGGPGGVAVGSAGLAILTVCVLAQRWARRRPPTGCINCGADLRR